MPMRGCSFGCNGFRKAHHFVCVLALGAGIAPAQELIGSGGAVHLFNSDAAILETQDIRKDLPCTVTPNKPMLGFDLKYHTGYEISVPLKELAGSDNQLTMVFRVTPEGHPNDPVYFSKHIP